MRARQQRRSENRHTQKAEAGEIAPPRSFVRSAAPVRHIAFALILLGVATGPFAPTIESTLTLRLVVHTFFVLAAALWAISMCLEGRIRLRRLGIGPWFLLVAGVLLISVLNARYKHPAIITVFMWLSNMLAFLFIAHEARSQRARLLLVGAVCASALVLSLHGIHQREVALPAILDRLALDEKAVTTALNLKDEMLYHVRGRIESMRVFSTFILPNSFAGFLALVVPVCVGLFLDRRRLDTLRTERRFTLLLGGLVLLPILLAFYFTKSKGGAVALFVAAVVFAVWASSRFLLAHRMQVAAGCVALAIVLAVAQASGLLPPLRDYPGSIAVRASYWQAGIEVIKEEPLTGIGPENFADAYSMKKGAQDQEARRVHNDYIQIGAETSLVGLLLYGVALLCFWRRLGRREAEPIFPDEDAPISWSILLAAILALAAAVFLLEGVCGGLLQSNKEDIIANQRVARFLLTGAVWHAILFATWVGVVAILLLTGRFPGPARHSYTTIGIACGLIAFFVHSLVDFNHYVGGIYQTVWVFMGVLLATCLSEEQPAYTVDRNLGPVGQLGVIIIATAISLFCLYRLVLPISDANGYFMHATDRELNPLTRRPRYTMKQRQKFAEKAVDAWPWDAQNHALLSDVLTNLSLRSDTLSADGATLKSQAITQLRKAIALNPFRSEYYARLAWLYEVRWRASRETIDYNDAHVAIVRTTELFPSNPQAVFNLARFHDLSGRYELALGKYLRAKDLSHTQYNPWRRFTKEELAEISDRIALLRKCVTDGSSTSPPAFESPRLQGLSPAVPLPQSSRKSRRK